MEVVATKGKIVRLENDPDRYIRVVKGGKYQARPIDLGERYDLGLFPTKAAARVAMLTSRVNTMLSIPMLYAMVGAQNLGA